jgi:hypothetical protein
MAIEPAFIGTATVDTKQPPQSLMYINASDRLEPAHPDLFAVGHVRITGIMHGRKGEHMCRYVRGSGSFLGNGDLTRLPLTSVRP